jgi:putative ATPase
LRLTDGMDDLFGGPTPVKVGARAPLAARFRPRTLAEYLGQEHLLGEGKPLKRLIEADRLRSALFFGPPGVGKTSLAELIAHSTRCRFERLNAVEASVGDLRKVLAAAENRYARESAGTILFIDEIHRFNKAQQDVLLPDMESGAVRLIGATTHNPSFYVNGPLVSRSQIFELRPLSLETMSLLIDRVLADSERGLGHAQVRMDANAREHLIAVSEGDARRLLNGLEIAVLTTPVGEGEGIHLTREIIEDCVQRRAVHYDKNEDEHYNTISAFIKSVRGSDPDAALYWLAKMIEAGEELRFIARRLMILAAEDVGLADPRGIMVAVAAQQAVEFLGMPEGRIPLAEATIYLATAPKSNSSIVGIDAALKAVREEARVEVPMHLKDAHYPGASALGHGAGYLYSHDFPQGIAPQDHGVKPGSFYQPSVHGYEKQVAERLAQWMELRRGKKNRGEESGWVR